MEFEFVGDNPTVIARRPKADVAISNLVEGRRLLRRFAPRNDIYGFSIVRLLYPFGRQHYEL